MPTTPYDGIILDAGGEVYNILSCGVLNALTPHIAPGSNITSRLHDWMTATANATALEVLLPASNSTLTYAPWYVDNLTIPGQWLLEGVGMQRTFVSGTPPASGVVAGAMISEISSAAKIAIANLRLDSNGLPYLAILSLGFVNPAVGPWGTEGYLRDVWIRDWNQPSGLPAARPDWGARLLGNVVEVDNLKVYGCRRGLQVTGTAVRAQRLTLAANVERALDLTGTAHTLHQVEVEGPGNGIVTVWVSGAAAANGGSIPITPPAVQIPQNVTLQFPNGASATLVHDAGTNATSLAVSGPTADIAGPPTALDAAGNTVTVAPPGAPAGATAIPVEPLAAAINPNTPLSFSNGVSVTVSALAGKGAVSLPVAGGAGQGALPVASAQYLPVAVMASAAHAAFTSTPGTPTTTLSVYPLPMSLHATLQLQFQPSGATATLAAGAQTGATLLKVSKITGGTGGQGIIGPMTAQAGTGAGAVTVVVAGAGAAAGSGSIPVQPLTGAVQTGPLTFSGTGSADVTVNVAAAGNAGDVSLAVEPLHDSVRGPDQAAYVPPAPVYIDAPQTDVSGMLISCAANTAYQALIFLAPLNTDQVHLSGIQVITRAGSSYGALINHDGLLFGRQTVRGATVTANEPRWLDYDTGVQQTYYISNDVANGVTGEMLANTLTIRQVHPGLRIVVGSDVASSIDIVLAAPTAKLGGKTYTVVNGSSNNTVYVRGDPSVAPFTLSLADQRVIYDARGFPVAPGATLEFTPAGSAKVTGQVVPARYSGRFVATAPLPAATIAAGATLTPAPVVSFAGAQVGDLVEVSLTAVLGGLQVWGEVTTVNNVTVYIHNPTSAGISLSAGTIEVSVRPTA